MATLVFDTWMYRFFTSCKQLIAWENYTI